MTAPAAPHALYRFYDVSDRLLYVGITSDPLARWKNHSRKKDWWREVTTIRVEHFDTRCKVEAAEVAAILAESPLYNIAYNSKAYRKAHLPRSLPSAPEHFGGSCWHCAYSSQAGRKHRGHLPVEMTWVDGELTTRYQCALGHEWKEEWGDALYRVAICKCDWCRSPEQNDLEIHYPC